MAFRSRSGLERDGRLGAVIAIASNILAIIFETCG